MEKSRSVQKGASEDEKRKEAKTEDGTNGQSSFPAVDSVCDDRIDRIYDGRQWESIGVSYNQCAFTDVSRMVLVTRNRYFKE